MPTFFTRRYGRPGEQVSTVEKIIGAVILLTLASLGVTVGWALTVRSEGEKATGPSLVDTTPDSRPRAASYRPFDLPKLEKDGWTGPQSVESFSPETVHQKINGRDGLYLAYGMVGMTFGTYKHPADEDRYVDVYVYHLGRGLNAFGCYKAEFAEGMPPIKTGRGGYRAEQSLFYWTGDHYVQLVAGDTVTDSDAGVLGHLAEQIAGKISDDGAVLWGDAILPKANRKPDSLGYERENGFSLDFLTEVFRADYTDGDAEYTLFIHRAASPAAARGLLDKYAAYLGKHGKLISRKDSPQGQTVVGEVMEMYDVVFCKRRYLGGVNGAGSLKLAQKHGAGFRDKLKAD